MDASLLRLENNTDHQNETEKQHDGCSQSYPEILIGPVAIEASTSHCTHKQNGKRCCEASQPQTRGALMRKNQVQRPENSQEEEIATKKERAKKHADMTMEILVDWYQ